MNVKSNILVCTHKKFNILKHETFLPVHVGKEISNVDLPYQRDNEGINISVKNKNYCELTALFWAWKNLIDFDFIGLCHYRRFFLFRNSNKINKSLEITEDVFFDNFDNFLFTKELMSDCDIILAKPNVLKMSLAGDYIYCHVPEDFAILRETVYSLYPDYKESFEFIMDKNNKLSPFNMFVTNKEILNEYCDWLFTILKEIEDKIYISQYPYQQRVFGFMAERLLNVFVYHKKLKVKYIDVAFIGTELKSKKNINEFISNSAKEIMFQIGIQKTKNK